MARYSFVVCRSSGEPVGEALAAKSRQLTRALNQPATATITLQLGDALASIVTPGSRLKVYRAATPAEAAVGLTRTLVFYGSLPAQNLTMDASSDTLVAMFKDPSWMLARRFLPGNYTTAGTGGVGNNPNETFTSTKQGAILQSLLARITNLLPSGIPGVRPYFETYIVPGGDTTTILRDRPTPRARTLPSCLTR